MYYSRVNPHSYRGCTFCFMKGAFLTVGLMLYLATMVWAWWQPSKPTTGIPGDSHDPS